VLKAGRLKVLNMSTNKSTHVCVMDMRGVQEAACYLRRIQLYCMHASLLICSGEQELCACVCVCV